MASRSVNSLSILSLDKWAELFPRARYDRFKQNPNSQSEENQNVKQHALKYLIVLEQPNDIILPYIERLKKTNSLQLNSSFGKHALTTLHIATMRDRFELVKALIEAGVDVNKVDAYGWTPLHHAALVSDKIFNLLISKGANQDAKTLVGGTYQDLRRLFGIEKSQLRDKILYKRLHQAQIEEIGIEELEQFTKLQCYSDEYRWPNEIAESLWTMFPKTYDSCYLLNCECWHKTVILPSYQKYRKEPPRLLVEEIEFQNSFQLQKKTVGLVAGEELKGGTIIAEYTGKVVLSDEELEPDSFEEYIKISSKFEYFFNNVIDASSHGSLARYINDGWPNVLSQSVFNEHGKDERTVFIASDPKGIGQGKAILWDYGCGQFNLKWGHYLISDKEQIRNFFRERPLKDYLEEINTLSKSVVGAYSKSKKIDAIKTLGWQQLEQRLLYPLNTPAVLIDLTCSRIIPPKDWTIILNDPDLMKVISFPPHRALLSKLLVILNEFYDTINSLEAVEETKPLARTTCTLLLQKEDTLSVLQMVNGLIAINRLLSEYSISEDLTSSIIEEIRSKLEEIISSLSHYKWEEDQEFSFLKEIKDYWSRPAILDAVFRMYQERL